MIALSEDNRVLAANAVTLQLLEVADRSHIVGKELSEVIGDNLGELFDNSGRCPETIHPFRDERNGKQFYGLLYKYKQPPRLNGLTVPPTQATTDDCRGELCDLRVLAGSDPQMQEAAQRGRKVIDKRIPILIQGETGTGKDLFSQALHRVSMRKDK